MPPAIDPARRANPCARLLPAMGRALLAGAALAAGVALAAPAGGQPAARPAAPPPAAAAAPAAPPTPAAPAVPNEEGLARARACMSCHAVERRLIGPAFRAVGQRYAGRPGTTEQLARKIVTGGGGVWGPLPMPANPRITPQEAQRLAAWVGSLR